MNNYIRSTSSKNKRISSVYIYIALILVLNLSGNPLFHMLRYKMSVILVLAFSAVLFFLFRVMRRSQNGIIADIKVLLCVFILLLSLCLTVAINNANISTYLAIFIQFLSAVLITNVIDIDSFEDHFQKVMVFYALTSIIFYFAQCVYPSLPYMFPSENGSYMRYYNVLYIYNFAAPLNAPNYIWPRNFGMFWEPGCYQFFLNLSLCFLFNTLNNKQANKPTTTDIFYIMVFAVAIITTKSATGICLLSFIILYNIRTIVSYFSNDKVKATTRFLVLVVCLLILGLSVSYDVISTIRESIAKINSSSYMGGNGFIRRLSLDKLSYLFYDGYPHLFGISFETLYANTSISIWNSIIEDCICLGFVFISVIVTGLAAFSYKHNKGKAVILIVIIATLCAESLLHTIFTFLLVCYGIRRK